LTTYKEFFLENYLPESSPSAIVISQSELPETGYMEVREPESQSVFSPNQGEVWGLLVLRGEGGDVDEARSFLPGVTRSSLRYRIRVEEENLPGGQNVLLLKTFDERADYDELASSLEDNSYYQSRVAGEEWIMCPVTEENFQKLMNEEGSLSDYLEFLGF
jgi:hypothetical protein